MTQEEKQLLLIDICARLPYGMMAECRIESGESLDVLFVPSHIAEFIAGSIIVKPYLRQMSSMTEEEKDEFDKLMNLVEERCINAYGKGGYTLSFTELNDWLNKNKFDYRGLIKKGLALEAKEGMYEIQD